MIRAPKQFEQPQLDDRQAAISVLHVLDSFSFGGAENLVVEMALHAPSSLHLSVASLSPPRPGTDIMFDRLRNAGLAPRHVGVRRLLDPQGFVRLVRFLRESDADVIHAHLGYSATLVPLAATLAGKPAIATLHLSPQDGLDRGERLKEWLSVAVPSTFGRLVLVSQAVFDSYRDRYPARGTRWDMIPNGVDLERFTGRPTGHGLHAPVDFGTGQVWACVAALRKDKEHLELVEAWRQVATVHPNARLLIVGDGEMRAEIESAVADAGLSGAIQLLGRREDVAEILARVDGVVSASSLEALPTSLIEGAACGLPVVAAAAGGTTEIVRDGVTGRVVRIHDPSALASALIDVIGNPSMGRRWGEAGRALVESRYSMTTWLDTLAATYRLAMDDHGRRRPRVSVRSARRPAGCRS